MQPIPPNVDPSSFGNDCKIIKESRCDKRVNIIWVLICITCLITHSVYTTFQYSKYPVTSELTTQFEESFVPPAFSYCIARSEIVKKTNITSDKRCKSPKMMKRALPADPNYQGICLLTIFEDMTHDVADTIDRLRVGQNLYDERSAMSKFLTPFMKTSLLKCVRFQNLNATEKINMESISQFWDWNKRLLRIMGSTAQLTTGEPYIHMYIHDAQTFPRGYLIKPYVGSIKHSFETQTITYQAIKTKYLPPPFFSKCHKHYQKHGIESSEECMEKCVYNNFTKGYPGYIPAQMTFTKREEMMGIADESYEKIQPMYEACRNECPTECQKNIFMPVKTASFSYKNGSYVLIIVSENAVVQIKFSAKITLYEYFIYMASIFGLWLGFSVLQFFQSLNPIINHILWQKNTKVTIKQQVTITP